MLAPSVVLPMAGASEDKATRMAALPGPRSQVAFVTRKDGAGGFCISKVEPKAFGTRCFLTRVMQTLSFTHTISLVGQLGDCHKALLRFFFPLFRPCALCPPYIPVTLCG